jgi:endosialidase-like protein
MAFQFPANPAPGQVFDAAPGVQYKWTGVAWCPYATQFPGLPIFQNPALFADGTQAAPGIAWANEPGSGFTRTAAETFRSMVTGKNVFSWNKGGFWFEPSFPVYVQSTMNIDQTLTTGATIRANGSIVIPCGNSYYARNPANTADWPVLHASTGNSIHIGWNGFDQTYLYGGGGVRVHAHGGGVELYGTVNASITGFANRALRLHNHGDQNQTAMVFHWQGIGGVTPYWVWGGDGRYGSEGTDMYVFHPADWSVNYANSAGYAGNSGQVSGIGGWNYGNRQKNPAYVWVTDGSTQDQYLTEPWYLRPGWAYRVDSIDNAYGGNVHSNITFDTHFVKVSVGMQFNVQEYYLNFAIGNPSWAWCYCRIRHAPGQWAGVDWDLAGSYYELRAGGQATKGYGGQWDGQSDIRLKKNVTPLDYGLNEIVKINPIEFEREFPNMETFPKRRIVGISAQEVDVVMPRMVYREPHDELGEVLCIRPDYIQYALVNAVKELAARVEQLEKTA